MTFRIKPPSSAAPRIAMIPLEFAFVGGGPRVGVAVNSADRTPSTTVKVSCLPSAVRAVSADSGRTSDVARPAAPWKTAGCGGVACGMPSTNRSGTINESALSAKVTASDGVATFGPLKVADSSWRLALAKEPGTFAAASAISGASGPGTASLAGSVRSRLA